MPGWFDAVKRAWARSRAWAADLLSPSAEPARPVRLPGETIWVAVILVAHLGLSLGFSAGPLWEGPDEVSHYKFVQYLRDRRNLPGPPYEGGTGGEVHQAPLYYLINAYFSQWLPDADFAQRVGKGNPYHGSGSGADGNFNNNSRFHYSIEAFPYTQSETALAVHLLRLSSVLFSLAGVAASYLILKRLWPGRADLRMLAFGIVAFWPQSLYMSGVLNNDNLVYMTGALGLLWMIRQSEDGPSWPRTVCLGLALGFGLLAKSSTAFLVFPLGAAMLLDRRTWRTLPLLTLVVLLAGGWWYIRNQIVYGEPTGYTLFYEFVPAARIPFGTMTLHQFITTMPDVYIGAWANFGDGAVAVNRLFYDFFDLLLAVMVIGMVIWLARAWREVRRDGLPPVRLRRWLIIGLYTISWFLAVSYIAYTSITGVSGRVIMPAVPGLAALMALGVLTLTPERLRLRLALSLTCFIGFIAAVCLFGYFRLSYLPEQVPSHIEAPLAYTFEGQAEVIGTRTPLFKGHRGDDIDVFVYWRALKPSATELVSFVHALEFDKMRVDSFPGDGNLMSTEWRPGQTWAEEYHLHIPGAAKPQSILTLTAGLYDPDSQVNLTALDAGGHETLPVIARVAVNGPAAPFEPDYRLGSAIGLATPSVERQGDQLKVCLKWLSISPVTTDYQVFVHVVSGSGALAGQADAQPKGGAYPTSAWAPGEAVAGCMTVDAPGLPQTGWHVALGLYDLSTGQRLPVTDRSGRTLANDEVTWQP